MQGFKAPLFLCVATALSIGVRAVAAARERGRPAGGLAALEAIAEVGEPLGEDGVLLTSTRMV